ncbi:hypothetical protein [Luteimonas fraxinea]|uniref:Uncharacterized protein n=1 Tax=Luteimonas fraxinea TaxID=2901869 RepID=A0ABS8U9Q4_9GAMM|nr:hypothetical protein [Luteimonas fraxinea]MCD9096207.1 hypothetical protein [Luteimonas fraxinea]
MALLNTADGVFIGSQPVDRLYRGAVMVWERLELAISALLASYPQSAKYLLNDFVRYTKAATRGPEKIGDPGFDDPSFWTNIATGFVVSGGKVSINAGGGQISRHGDTSLVLTNGVPFEYEIEIVSYTSGGVRSSSVTNSSNGELHASVGVHRGIVLGAGTGWSLRASSATVLEVGRVSLKALTNFDATLFQDAEGTIPVTAVEQPVGRMLDLSGHGFHYTQATPTARGILSARINLLESTETYTGSNWGNSINIAAEVNSGVAKLSAIADGGARFGGSYNRFGGSYLPITFTSSVDLKAGTFGWARLSYSFAANAGGVTINLNTGEVFSAGATAPNLFSVTPLADGWFRVTLTRISSAYALNHLAVFLTDFTGQSDGGWNTGLVPIAGQHIFMRRPQFELGTAATRYQRVNSATDYDTVGFPHYLVGDGVDDLMTTANFGLTQAGYFFAASMRVDTLTGSAGQSNFFGLLGGPTTFARLSVRASGTGGASSVSATFRQSGGALTTALVGNAFTPGNPFTASANFDATTATVHADPDLTGALAYAPIAGTVKSPLQLFGGTPGYRSAFYGGIAIAGMLPAAAQNLVRHYLTAQRTLQ